jgi:hypothetical protein
LSYLGVGSRFGRLTWGRSSRKPRRGFKLGTLRGFAPPFGPPPATATSLVSPFGDFGTCTFPTTPARYARALALGLAKLYAARRAGCVPRDEGAPGYSF